MICRIIEKKEQRFYVITETKRLLWLYGGPSSLQVGDFIETSMVLFDNKYEDEFVLFHGKVTIFLKPFVQDIPHYATPCEGCTFRLRKLTQGCNPCSPQKLKNET